MSEGVSDGGGGDGRLVAERETVLGLDLGTNSVGWALVDAPRGQPQALLAAGVRIFDAGTDGDIETGRDEARNAKRRQARSSRRLLWRRARRVRTLFHCLQDAGLLPKGRGSDAQARHELLNDLDRRLLATARAWPEAATVPPARLAHMVPYLLRARALDHRLERDELGRALFHLGQRRGFLSNRKAADDGEEARSGPVQTDIESLASAMVASGARTLGEYFSRLDPERERVRRRWTARAMYAAEFDAIWAAQAPHHATVLTDALRKRLRALVLEQRPLKSQADKIGSCDLLPGKRRAPWALPSAQRFRMLQRVNDLILTTAPPEGEVRPLTPEERRKLVDALDARGDMTFDKVRRHLGLPRGTTFNLEAGGEKTIPGNRTAARLGDSRVFGEAWARLAPSDQERVVEDWVATQKDDTLAARGRAWGLTDEAARRFATVKLEAGYCNLSRAAIRRVLPHLEAGVRYATIRREQFPGLYEARTPDGFLPPAPRLRNPIVERTLSQARKVVNAVVREYGLPGSIRVELARDVQKPRKARVEASNRMRDRQKERDAARARLLAEVGIAEPTNADLEKVLLWEECAGICPYTGRSIAFGALFGSAPEFDVEHILPRSRSLDNSFLNKTLCAVSENRNRKRNQTPFEAYAHDRTRWEQILTRVRAFRGKPAREKLRRFMLPPDEVAKLLEDFSSRQLNDTRFASRACADYLGTLYGGRSDADHRRRIDVGRGQATSMLRSIWNLNSILGDDGAKKRTDHRHHAIDAVCVAMTSPATLKAVSEAAQRSEEMGRRRLDDVAAPWLTFRADVERAIQDLVVSHAVRRKVNGPLHEETIYPPEAADGTRHVRRPLESLGAKDIADDDFIVDAAVRDAVRRRLAEAGGDPRAFKDEANLPEIVGRDGRRTRIRKVRVRESVKTAAVGSGHRVRHVKPGANHHVAIFEVPHRGGVRWVGEVVTRLEAMRRVRAGEPVVRRERDGGGRFVFSLAQGEAVCLNHRGRSGPHVVANVSISSAGRVELQFRWHSDARTADAIRVARERIRMTPEDVRKAMSGSPEKCVVDALGRLRSARD